jgi:hypothetical protein
MESRPPYTGCPCQGTGWVSGIPYQLVRDEILREVQNRLHRRRYHQPQERRGRPEVGPNCHRCKFKEPGIVPGNRSTTWHSWWTTQAKSGNPRRGMMSSNIAGKDRDENVDRHQGFRRTLRRAIRVGCRLGYQPSPCQHRSPGGAK